MLLVTPVLFSPWRVKMSKKAHRLKAELLLWAFDGSSYLANGKVYLWPKQELVQLGQGVSQQLDLMFHPKKTCAEIQKDFS